MGARTTAQIEITATNSKLAQGLSAAKREVGIFARGVGDLLKRATDKKGLMGGGFSVLKGTTANVAGNLIGKGIDAMADAANEVRDFERGLMRMQIATDGNAASTASMRKEFTTISRATAVSRAEVLAGAQAYVGFTGDAQGAAAAAKLFADVSAATGASTTDVAQAMSALKTSMKITATEGEAAFSALIVQGKGGAVEIKDMAGELAALAPIFALFKGGSGVSGLRELGAGFQVVMKNSATASDAATKYKALMESLNDPRTLKQLRSMGVNVKDSKGQLLDASTVFERLASSKKLFAKENLSKAFGRSEARLAVLALREHIGTYRDLREAAMDTGAVQRDAMTFLQSDAGKIDATFNSLKLSLAEAFTPERIKLFADALGKAVELAAKMIGYIDKAVNYVKSKTVEGQTELEVKNRANQARARGPEVMLTQADTFLKQRARYETAGHSGGRKGRFRDAFSDAALEEGVALRQEAEAMIRKQNPWDSRVNHARIDPALMGPNADPAKQKDASLALLNGLRAEISAGISAGFAAANIVTKIGDNQVARAASKSTHARRNP